MNKFNIDTILAILAKNGFSEKNIIITDPALEVQINEQQQKPTIKAIISRTKNHIEVAKSGKGCNYKSTILKKVDNER